MSDPIRWTRIRELFHAVCERDVAEREAFLARACAGDAALLAEVRALLDVDAAARPLIENTVREAAGALERDAVVGRLVGPWRLLRELGHGGMGNVYLAERADGAFEQQAALKLLRRGMDSEQILERFHRERQILARLQHPNIARLLDGGLTEDGQPYFAMEHVAGEPIDRYCDRHALTVAARLRLFLDVCRAVAYAHAALVVHRDLKPANILVTAEGQVRLLDFGIAKVLAEDGDASTLTATGLHVMTPAYASPEQVRAEPVGTATDIYSLGVILYELLAGVRPYEVDSRNLVEIERVICHEDPERPSTRLGRTTGDAPDMADHVARRRGADLRRLRKQLAGDLDVICLKALRKETERRYRSVEALLEDIRRHLDGLPVLARPDTFGYRLRKTLRRHRTGVAAAAAVLVGVSGLTGFYLARLADERDRARLEAAKATEVAGFLQSLFEVSDPSRSRGETVTARELLDDGAARIAEELNAQPEVQTAMMRVIGEVYLDLGLHAQARPLLEQALARNRALYAGDHAETAASLAAAATLAQNTGDSEGAEALLREALAMQERLTEPEHLQTLALRAQLAYLVENLGRTDEAERLFRETLAGYRAVLPPDDARISALLVRLGSLLRRVGRFDDAEPLLREALVALRTRYGDVHPRVASAVRNLAALRRDQGAYDEADTLYQEAIALRRQLYGDRHPDVATAIHSYALLLRRMGERDRALARFTEAVEMLERIHPDGHPNLGIGYYDLGLELRDQGRYDAAVTWFRRAIRMDDRSFPADHPYRGESRVGLASVYMAQERYASAESLLREALGQFRAEQRADDESIGAALSDLGFCLTRLGRYEEAERTLLDAHGLLEAVDEAGPDGVQEVRARLVALYEAWKKPTEADRYR